MSIIPPWNNNDNMNQWSRIRYWHRLHDYILTLTLSSMFYFAYCHYKINLLLLEFTLTNIRQSIPEPYQGIRKTTLSKISSEGNFQMSNPHFPYFTTSLCCYCPSLGPHCLSLGLQHNLLECLYFLGFTYWSIWQWRIMKPETYLQ